MFYVNALFEPDSEKGGFVVYFPDFSWGVTQGETEEEAAEMALDAITMIINELIKRGEEVPSPSKRRGAKYRVIRLPALATAKVELYQAFRSSGVRKAELARRLGIPKTNVDRLFNLHHSTRLEHLDAAFHAIGKRLLIQVEEAAA
jgi:antitoxin HicB